MQRLLPSSWIFSCNVAPLGESGNRGRRAAAMAPWSEKPMPGVLKAALVAVQVYAFYYACSAAYNIRLHAVNEYGRLIHEFDPWCVPRAPRAPSWAGRARPRASPVCCAPRCARPRRWARARSGKARTWLSRAPACYSVGARGLTQGRRAGSTSARPSTCGRTAGPNFSTGAIALLPDAAMPFLRVLACFHCNVGAAQV